LENPFNEEDYKHPSPEILNEVVLKRLEHPDCNPGAIFFNLTSPKMILNPEEED